MSRSNERPSRSYRRATDRDPQSHGGQLIWTLCVTLGVALAALLQMKMQAVSVAQGIVIDPRDPSIEEVGEEIGEVAGTSPALQSAGRIQLGSGFAGKTNRRNREPSRERSPADPLAQSARDGVIPEGP